MGVSQPLRAGHPGYRCSECLRYQAPRRPDCGIPSGTPVVGSKFDRRARATIARRLCTVSGFYRYAVEEELLAHSPAVHVRRPRLDYESHSIGLEHNEVGSLLVAAGQGAANEHALISLLAINGLRILKHSAPTLTPWALNAAIAP